MREQERGLPAGPRRSTAPLLARRRAQRLFEGDDQLVVVHSGRFGGATSLLRAWCDEVASSESAVAYVLAPSPETTEQTYWAALLKTLRSPDSQPPVPLDGADVAFAAVMQAVARLATPCVLLLDDLHLVRDPVARIDELLDHAPAAGVRIIATTRTAGGWPARLARTPGQKLVATESARFDVDDVKELLRLSHLDLHDRTPEIIHRLTYGLPCLVDAVCASVPLSELFEPVHLDEYVEAVVDREVNRTITDDPLLRNRRLPLLLSAAAEPLDGGSALPLPHQRDDPDQFLRVVDQSGLAYAGGSPSDPEWRFPDTVRASLLRLAGREVPEALQQYRADLVGRWLDLDRPDRALSVAGELEDWPRAVQILRDYAPTLYSRDYPTTMTGEVLARIPSRFLAGDPILTTLQSMHHHVALSRDAPAPPLPADSGDEGRTPSEPAVAGSDELIGTDSWEDLDYDARVEIVFRAVDLRIRGEFDASARLCDVICTEPLPVLASMSEEDRDAQGFAFLHVAITFILVGRFSEAEMALRRSLRTAVQPFIHRDVAGKLALINAVLGNPVKAREALAEERRHPTISGPTEALVRPAGDVASALISLDNLDTDAAMSVLGDLGPPDEREELWGFVLYAFGLLALVNNTPALGLQFLDTQLPRFATMRRNGTVVEPILDALRADLLLTCDRVGAASHAVAGSTHPFTAAVRGRILLLSDDPRGALSLARTALTDSRTVTRTALELHLVAAAAALAIGDQLGARQYASGASALHRMTGLQLPFRSLPGHVMRRLAELDHGFPIDLHALVPDYGKLTFIDNELHPVPSATRQHGSGLTAPLTSREHAVLRELATDASIGEIAARRFVSPNTVKSQVRAVYRKLRVTNRADALDAAERLRLT